MKVNKIIFSILSIASLPCAFIPSTSCSCNKSQDLDDSSAEGWIKNRTFSIGGRNNSGATVYGTGWIVADATKTVTNDYKYYMATNMHVLHPWFSSIGLSGSFDLYYADYSDANLSGNISYNKYHKFASVDKSLLRSINDNQTDFRYTSYTPTTYFIKGIDLAIFPVDFGTPATTSIKKKLDNLNKCQEEKGSICNFAQISRGSSEINKVKYVGGYPFNTTTHSAKWEFHTIGADDLEYEPINQEYVTGTIGHSTGSPDRDQKGNVIVSEDPTEKYYFYDISPQLVTSVGINTDFMDGGSSGSMIINSDFKTLGVYWGGWGDSAKKYHPCYSLINTPEQNFIAQYI